jgi:hypothetical protein
MAVAKEKGSAVLKETLWVELMVVMLAGDLESTKDEKQAVYSVLNTVATMDYFVAEKRAA